MWLSNDFGQMIINHESISDRFWFWSTYKPFMKPPQISSIHSFFAIVCHHHTSVLLQEDTVQYQGTILLHFDNVQIWPTHCIWSKIRLYPRRDSSIFLELTLYVFMFWTNDTTLIQNLFEIRFTCIGQRDLELYIRLEPIQFYDKWSIYIRIFARRDLGT